MTSRPTVEPAGAYKPIKDLTDLEDRLALWCQIRDPSPLVKHSSVKELLTASRDAVRELLAARQQIKTLADKLFDADNCHSADHAAAMSYFGQAMEHDQWRIERDEARQQLAEMRGDASRYQWLRSRINWNDNMVVFGLLTSDQREWTHIDVRPVEARPDSEHIDEYIDAQLAPLAPTSQPSRGKCGGCGNEIDPDTCGCGEPINGYHDNHTPVPMSCDCHRSTSNEADCAQPERQGADK